MPFLRSLMPFLRSLFAVTAALLTAAALAIAAALAAGRLLHGDVLAYNAADGANQWTLNLLDVTTRRRVMLGAFAPYVGDFVWSPDGASAAYVIRTFDSAQVYVAPARAFARASQVATGRRVDALAWSPDGSTLAFLLDDRVSQQVYSVRADGSDLRQRSFLGENVMAVLWSPDGAALALNTRGGLLYWLDLASGEVRLLNERQPGLYPAWSPDGAWLAFTAAGDSDHAPQVIALPLADGTLRPLTALTAGAQHPLWAGDALLAVSYPLGATQVYRLFVDGSPPALLAETPATLVLPVVSPRGRLALLAISDQALMVWEGAGLRGALWRAAPGDVQEYTWLP